MKSKHHHRKRKWTYLFTLLALLLPLTAFNAQAQVQQTIDPVQDATTLALPPPTPICERTIKANVVALDQVIMYNRLGTVNPGGMIYALRQDVVAIDPLKGIVAGNVRLRANKRPRPIVLRMNIGDCLQVTFTNLLSQQPKSHGNPDDVLDKQPATRSAGIHVNGMELVGTIGSDGSNVGTKPPRFVPPGSLQG